MTFTFTMDRLDADKLNAANDVAWALRQAFEDIEALGGSFDITKSGTVENIQGEALAAWTVSE